MDEAKRAKVALLQSFSILRKEQKETSNFRYAKMDMCKCYHL